MSAGSIKSTGSRKSNLEKGLYQNTSLSNLLHHSVSQNNMNFSTREQRRMLFFKEQENSLFYLHDDPGPAKYNV